MVDPFDGPWRYRRLKFTQQRNPMNYSDPHENEHLVVDAEKRLQVIKTGNPHRGGLRPGREIEDWMNATDMPTSRFIKWRNLVDTFVCWPRRFDASVRRLSTWLGTLSLRRSNKAWC